MLYVDIVPSRAGGVSPLSRARNPSLPGSGWPSAKPDDWRKAKKARTSSTIGALPPPSANQDSWRRGSDFPRKTHVYGQTRCYLAERVPGWIAARIDWEF